MRKCAREAVCQGRPLIIAAGGDDSIRAVLFGMEEAGYFQNRELRERTTFGILPLGTFNNFAHFLGLPLGIEEALEVAHSGELNWVDLGCADGTLFIESVGVGLDVAAWRVFPPENPNLLHRLWDGGVAVLRALSLFRPRRYSLLIDGVARQVKAYEVTVANSNRFSAGLQIAPSALPDDGLLDLCVIPALSKLGLLLAIPLVLAGKHTAYLKGVYYVQAREVQIAAEGRFAARVDSQITQHLPLTVKVLPRILPIRLPAPL